MLSFRCKSCFVALIACASLFACAQEPPPPPPVPPPDPAVSAKELNALAAPVIPKPGSGIKLKSLPAAEQSSSPATAPATETPQQQAASQKPPSETGAGSILSAISEGARALFKSGKPQAEPAPPTVRQDAPASLAPAVPEDARTSLAPVVPRDAPSLAPIVPQPQAAAKLGSKPGAAAPKPGLPAAAVPTENVEALVNPVLPGSKVATKQVARPVLDKRDLAALSADFLPPPPSGTQPPSQAAPPQAAAASPPPAAAPAPDPNNTFAAALPSGERAYAGAGTPAAWLITAKGVGSLRPGARLLPAGDIGAHYQTSFYSDAEPIEGFAFDEPPVFIAVRNGPFAAWGRAHAGEHVPDAIKQRAIEQALAGKLAISMLVVTSKGPKTDRGVGVGDSYASFAKAYPGAGTPAKFPTLWEDPTCVITQKTLWFFFDRCDEKSKLTRIVVRGRR